MADTQQSLKSSMTGTTTAAIPPQETAHQRPGSAISSTIGHPIEQLEVEAPTAEPEVEYPTGAQLWLNVASIMVFSFIRGLDLLIVAPTVPSLTNHFKTVSDIGWYSSVYGLVTAATNVGAHSASISNIL
jgi:hypothetical protein